VYADAQLYAFDEGKDLDEQKSWPLSSEGLRDAVRHAASSQALPPLPEPRRDTSP
jgi:hypothetical protein